MAEERQCQLRQKHVAELHEARERHIREAEQRELQSEREDRLKVTRECELRERREKEQFKRWETELRTEREQQAEREATMETELRRLSENLNKMQNSVKTITGMPPSNAGGTFHIRENYSTPYRGCPNELHQPGGNPSKKDWVLPPVPPNQPTTGKHPESVFPNWKIIRQGTRQIGPQIGATQGALD